MEALEAVCLNKRDMLHVVCADWARNMDPRVSKESAL